MEKIQLQKRIIKLGKSSYGIVIPIHYFKANVLQHDAEYTITIEAR